MKKEKVINKDILDKIYSLDESDKVIKFILDALVWEYENIDKQKPSVTAKFDKLVDKGVED